MIEGGGMISVDGLTITLDQLVAALKLPAGGQRQMLREAQKKRAEKYGIKVQSDGGALSIPARFARLGAKDGDFGDPTNYKFIVWLSKPDREALSPAQLKQVQNAQVRFSQFGDRYDPLSRAAVQDRIQQARRKFKIGEFAETEKADWESKVEIAKLDEEKQVALGIALKASGGTNGVRADSQKDVITAEEVEKAAYGFMLNSRVFDLHHKRLLPESKAAVVESYLAPVDFEMGGTEVKKGDWVAAVKFFDKDLWQDVKEGKIAAFSIKGVGMRKPLAETSV
jgi:hypothetical protein